MKTRIVSTKGKEVFMGDGLPTILIGERINPFGKSGVKEALLAGKTDVIKAEGRRQAEAGADVLNVSVAAFGVDEVVMLPRVLAELAAEVDVPFGIESRSVEALEAALAMGVGRPIINSVNGEAHLLEAILPLVKRYDTAVIALASDSAGIPSDPKKRFEVMGRIVDQAEKMGIDRSSIIADCLAESVGINPRAADTTLETMMMVKEGLGVNLVLGASNISFGLPKRAVLNASFLTLAVKSGLDCAIVNVESVRPHILAADLLSGRDSRARRYMAYCRTLKSP